MSLKLAEQFAHHNNREILYDNFIVASLTCMLMYPRPWTCTLNVSLPITIYLITLLCLIIAIL